MRKKDRRQKILKPKIKVEKVDEKMVRGVESSATDKILLRLFIMVSSIFYILGIAFFISAFILMIVGRMVYQVFHR
jgi:hypothetical protein